MFGFFSCTIFVDAIFYTLLIRYTFYTHTSGICIRLSVSVFTHTHPHTHILYINLMFVYFINIIHIHVYNITHTAIQHAYTI